MGQEDIDEWYEEKKEKLTDDYMSKLKKYDDMLKADFDKKMVKVAPASDQSSDNKSPEQKAIASQNEKEPQELKNRYRKKKAELHEKLKTDYLENMKKLHDKYDEKSRKGLDSNLKWHFFNHRLNMFWARLLEPVERLKEKYLKKQGKKET
ncbi:hypothetical protein JXC34_03745 [Candidatus Woesearchaeota archaeon]|nr:hypothetical protein [Candidatus Woesearchaeota archaeon]